MRHGKIQWGSRHRQHLPGGDQFRINRGISTGCQLQPVAKDIPLALPRQIKIGVVGQVQQGVPLLRRGGIVDNEGILLSQAVAHLHMQPAGVTLLTCFCRTGEHHHIINVLGAPLPQAAVKASLAAVQVVAAVIGRQLILLAV